MKLLASRHGLTVALSVSIAFMVNYVYSSSNECWIVLAAFLVSETSKGTPFKQSMTILIAIILGMAVSFCLQAFIKQNDIIYLVFSILFIASSYVTLVRRSLSEKNGFVIIVFAITLLITLFTVTPENSLDYFRSRVVDAVIGAVIAMICRLLLLPANWEVEFSKGILPILSSLNEYSKSLSENINNSIVSENKIMEKRINVENALLKMYPSWIYETGFNRGLRSGFRFFLVNIERVAECLFSMDDIKTRGMDSVLLDRLRGNLLNVMDKQEELFAILIEYFQRKTIPDTTSDFTSDMTQLENAVREIIPDNIEVLSLSPTFLTITAFIRDMKDLRGLLLQLVMSLPVKNGEDK